MNLVMFVFPPSFLSVSPPIRKNVQAWFPQNGFAWNFILEAYTKICRKIPNFVKVWQNIGHFSWRHRHVFRCRQQWITIRAISSSKIVLDSYSDFVLVIWSSGYETVWIILLLFRLIPFVVTAFYSLIILLKYMLKTTGERPQAYLTPLLTCIGSHLLLTSSIILLLFFSISCCRLVANLLRFCLLSLFSVAFSYLNCRSFFS